MDISPENIHVVVIGAGVIGLTTAIRTLEAGFRVSIVAEHFPGDVKSIYYTSPWAGAHHVSHAEVGDLQMDEETFHTLWKLSEGEAEGCFMKIPHIECREEEEVGPCALEFMPDFRRLDSHELLPGSKSGYCFNTLTIDTPKYLPYLLQRFLSLGGTISRNRVQHVSQVIDGAFTRIPPDAVLVCAGLGARTLGGVEDKDVHPIRGQIVLIRAPWIKSGRTVILGGTKADDDWYPHPRPETTDSILHRTLTIFPELVPPPVRAKYSDDPTHRFTIEDLKPIIIENGCGLRPARKGGIRLESEVMQGTTPRKVIVVHNYGHGGAGYQSSWGSATIAISLLQKALTGFS
ncbi:hypothetical protein FRB99_003707 [Tulasnella sp. 403]|nr:hypothetical protein FRB99_003707 [Tulasnella sp. 403]